MDPCTRGQLAYGPPLDFSFKDLYSIEGTPARLQILVYRLVRGHLLTPAYVVPY